MKTVKNIFAVALGFTAMAATAQEATVSGGYKGEGFSLEGALAMFKQAKSPAEFEKLINEEGNNVNNLDLNNDGETDYITVTDIKDGDAHAVVLSTYLDNNEKQDIATIGIEKTGTERAILQIEGDEDLYADGSIIEPQDIKTTVKGGKGPDMGVTDVHAIVVNVWIWPVVQFIYEPAYVVYVSPWHWRAYPVWYRPWRPVHYTVFYGHCAPYRTYYRPAPSRRVAVAYRAYAPYRRTAVVVHNSSPRRYAPDSRQNSYRNSSTRNNAYTGRNNGNYNTRNNSRSTNNSRGYSRNNTAVTGRNNAPTRTMNQGNSMGNRNTAINSGRSNTPTRNMSQGNTSGSRNMAMNSGRNINRNNMATNNGGGSRNATMSSRNTSRNNGGATVSRGGGSHNNGGAARNGGGHGRN
ncbi:hypothetical protein ACLI1A_02630 [Flavobacterium sp. RHBU_3]|uniref:hypothetical protein n=1 Tax=Flavobacterium sp. RHBU_3 TaxID=3391184 RepID=UPI00398569D0